MNAHEQQVEDSLAKYRQRRDELGEFQRQVAALAVTKVAPRKVVSVTAGGQGEIKEVSFPSTAYKNLSSAELGSIITKTIEEARAAVLDRMAELMAPMLPSGVDARMLVRGKADLGSFMPEDPDDTIALLGTEDSDSIVLR